MNGKEWMMKERVLRDSLDCETTCVLTTDPGKKLWMTVNPAAGRIKFMATVDEYKCRPTSSLEEAVAFYQRNVSRESYELLFGCNGGMNDDRS